MKRHSFLQVRRHMCHLKRSRTVLIFQHTNVILRSYPAFHCLFMEAFLNPAPKRWSRCFLWKIFFVLTTKGYECDTHKLVEGWLFIFHTKIKQDNSMKQVRSKFSCWNLTNEISSRIILLFCSIICAENRQVFVVLSTNIQTSRENNHSDSHQPRRSVPHISCGLCCSLGVPWDHQHTFLLLHFPNRAPPQ